LPADSGGSQQKAGGKEFGRHIPLILPPRLPSLPAPEIR
jgi:hypothetical protein